MGYGVVVDVIELNGNQLVFMYAQGDSQYGVTGEYRACVIGYEINV